MREKFDELLKKARESFEGDQVRFWEDGDLIENGVVIFEGRKVHEESEGAGEKYQTYKDVYEYHVDGETVYLSLIYVGSGSYFSGFYYCNFELEEVERTVRTVEIVEYL